MKRYGVILGILLVGMGPAQALAQNQLSPEQREMFRKKMQERKSDPQAAARTEKLRAKADVDGNGQVSAQERDAMREKLHQVRANRAGQAAQ